MKPNTFFIISIIGIASFVNGNSFTASYFKLLKFKAIDIIDKSGRNTQCSRHLKSLIMDLFNIKNTWALNMLDASAKPQTGFLTGNIYHMGNFDQCISLREDKAENGVIEGQYCSVFILPVKNSSSDVARVLDFVKAVPELLGIKEGAEVAHILRLLKTLYGICIPKSCNADNIQKIWNYVENTFRLPVHITAHEIFCSHKGKVAQEYDFDKSIFITFGIIFGLMIISTLYHLLFHQYLKDPQDNIWIAFSVAKNIATIFSNNDNMDQMFNCISGLKVISMFWIIYGHRVLFNFFSGTINAVEVFQWTKYVSSLVVTVAPFSVDTFLSISGLMLSYKYLQICDMNTGKMSFPFLTYYVLRFLRLWPGLIATVLFYIGILKYLNDGPLWPIFMYKITYSCRNTWWLTTLFMTNFVGFNSQCVEPTWYLAVDTQLYFIAPFVLIYLNKHPKRTYMVCIGLILISASYAYVITVHEKQKWLTAFADDEYHSRIYQSTFVRMPVWMIGILTGALLYKCQQVKIPKGLNAFLWTLAMVLLGAVIFSNYIMIQHPYNEYSAGAFNALARPAWGLSICTIIFLCATGYGGIVNNILSHGIFRILVRISYSVYLVHMAVITIISGGKRTSAHYSNFASFHAFLGDLLFVFAMALVWSLAFESPFINIAKILVNQNGQRRAITEKQCFLKRRQPENYKITYYYGKKLKIKKYR